MLAEFGTEVNGDWFPWNGRWNGGGDTGSLSDLHVNSSRRSLRAYRHGVRRKAFSSKPAFAPR